MEWKGKEGDRAPGNRRVVGAASTLGLGSGENPVTPNFSATVVVSSFFFRSGRSPIGPLHVRDH